MRRRLIESLKQKGLNDPAVIQAMMDVPRHLFVDNVFAEHAYEDKAFPIAAGQTISHPSTVAIQSQLLELQPGMTVLEIGTGSGYQAAVLAQMEVKLVTIERQKMLYDRTKPLLTSMGYRMRMLYGDGYKGKVQFAPYDRILVTCGAPYIPDALLEQLGTEGILVIPVGEDGQQEMIKISRKADGRYLKEKHGNYSFVPMLEERNSR